MINKMAISIIILILLSSCNYSYTEDKLSKIATALNLAKPPGESQSRIVIQCDADTPTECAHFVGL